MPSNTTALLILLSTLAIVLLAMGIVAVLAYRARLREAEEDEYFPPDSFPEIEIDARRFHYDQWPSA